MTFELKEGSAVDFVHTNFTEAHNLDSVYTNFLANRVEAGGERC